MELILSEETISSRGMKHCHKTMIKTFKNTVVLTKYWGPVQMCVYYLEYDYMPKNYKIILECERGIITIKVSNQYKNEFSPWMVYPEFRYFHYQDVDKDIKQLIDLTYIAINNNETKFYTQRQITKLSRNIDWD